MAAPAVPVAAFAFADDDAPARESGEPDPMTSKEPENIGCDEPRAI